MLPVLDATDVVMEPSLSQLAAMAREDPESLAAVSNFTLRRPGAGSVRWLEAVDVRGLDLGAIVRIGRGSIEVSNKIIVDLFLIGRKVPKKKPNFDP